MKTTLPSPDDGSNILHVFARCYDVYGRHKTAAVTITIEGGDTVEFDPNTSDRYTETIKRNLERGRKTRVSDIVAMSSSLMTLRGA